MVSGNYLREIRLQIFCQMRWLSASCQWARYPSQHFLKPGGGCEAVCTPLRHTAGITLLSLHERNPEFPWGKCMPLEESLPKTLTRQVAKALRCLPSGRLPFIAGERRERLVQKVTKKSPRADGHPWTFYVWRNRCCLLDLFFCIIEAQRKRKHAY